MPRVRARELWRVDEPYLAQAQDDATLLAIHDLERRGLDVITDGEIRRESYSNRFATALEGIDLDNPGSFPAAPARERGAARGRADPPPRAGRGARPPLPAQPHGPDVKITLPGPFTMSQQA